MKLIKWKSLITTSLVCLLAIIPGVILWEKLPDKMAIHFDFNNNPDNFASKGFTVFLIPVLMMVLQIICCIINDINAHKHKNVEKIDRVLKWIIPVTAIILQFVTVAYGTGFDIDMRRVAGLIVGGMFLVTGNYLPKLSYIKNYDLEADKAKKINRFVGFETVILGIVFIISSFLPPIATMISLLLLIPYTIISIIYGVRIKNGSI